VVVSYGTHSNDFLLIEYGFMLAKNKHDSTTLDEAIFSLLETASKEILEQYGYLGSYYLTATGVCYRTQVAVRAMVTSAKRMQEFLDGEYDGAKEEKKMRMMMKYVLQVFRAELEGATGGASEVNVSEHVKEVVLSRRREMIAMLDVAEAAMIESGDLPA
jgi:hypothetical protein